MVVWKVANFFKADAEKVHEEIMSLGESFTAEDIVNKARDEKSELHQCFEWRDDIAAEKWRLHTARLIVTQLVIRTETTDNTPVAVRVISSSENKNEYVPTRVLIRNEASYADLLDRAKRELESFKQKYATLEELREIFMAIDSL